MCNFASRQITPIYCQGRSWKGTAAHHPGGGGFVWRGDPGAGVQLQAIGHGHAAAALNGRAHVGGSFKRLSDRHREVPHAVDSVLELSWGRDTRLYS